ncbi:hypothetical protein N0V93_002964 [Gnomoniopsis smithogilvyi]|uniref:NAD-dependent epimerase/dehydratase domain-containing protein n=1 Tax=Gnomoniopsis smithogilvyi TaxID=1191159 RepID=A0A9W9CZN9_9PEZI|nr:hypothetical protein N0V93_002964 [Gnomoniopsis smithogilvyi]
MDSYMSSSSSSAAESSPLTSSPLSTPATFDLEDAPTLHGLGAYSSTSDPTFVLVIGGLGFIGSHTVLELLRAGYNVIVVDNLSNSYETVLHNVKSIAGKEHKEKGTQMPLVHFHRVDYRSRSMRFLLESYTDLVPVTKASSPSSPTSDSDEPERRQMAYQSRITGVIHFAAFKSVSESIGKPLAYYNNNVCGLVSLLELLDKFAIRNFIFSSSATVYGSKANDGVPLREEDLVHFPETTVDANNNPVDLTPSVAGLTCPYGRTKYMAEAIMADLAEADDRWRLIALRYFNPVGCDPSGLLGENPRNAPTNLYPVITQVLTGDRGQLDVFGSDWDTRDGSAVRDFVHVLDVARGHIAALRPAPASVPAEAPAGGETNASTAAPGGGNKTSTTSASAKLATGFRAYNLGSGNGTTVLEAVRSLEAAAGQPIPLNLQGRRAGDVGMCVASNVRAQTELGWMPRESITQCAVDLWNFVSRTVGVKA